jgi:hypothetical protein
VVKAPSETPDRKDYRESQSGAWTLAKALMEQSPGELWPVQAWLGDRQDECLSMVDGHGHHLIDINLHGSVHQLSTGQTWPDWKAECRSDVDALALSILATVDVPARSHSQQGRLSRISAVAFVVDFLKAAGALVQPVWESTDDGAVNHDLVAPYGDVWPSVAAHLREERPPHPQVRPEAWMWALLMDGEPARLLDLQAGTTIRTDGTVLAVGPVSEPADESPSNPIPSMTTSKGEPRMSTVYILTNEAMPGIIKIGMTTTSVEQRMLGLDTTGVPLPFECYYAARVSDMAKVEKALHEAFGDHRVRKSREFFNLDPYRAKVILELLAIEEVTPRTDVVAEADDLAALAQAHKRRAKFSFAMADVPVGATLSFAKGQNITATALDGNRIEFRGEVTSLSGAAATILQEMGWTSTSVQGTAYWLYDGETLDDRRRQRDDQATADAEGDSD